MIAGIALLIIGFAIGYGFGFGKGSYQTMVWGLRVAENFINDIDFDEEAIATGIFQNQNRIGGCFDIPPI